MDNGQSTESGNIRYTRRRKAKLRLNTVCVGHQYAQANTTEVNVLPFWPPCTLISMNQSSFRGWTSCGIQQNVTPVIKFHVPLYS